jgi:hypothetical protein
MDIIALVLMVLGALEFLCRSWPSSTGCSLVERIVRILDIIIPDRATDGGCFERKTIHRAKEKSND